MLAILVLQMPARDLAALPAGQERSTFYGVFMVAKVLVEVSLQIWFVAHEGLGLQGQFYGVLASEVLVTLALTALLLPRVGLTFSAPIFGLMFAYALPLIPNGMLQFCLHSADRFILNALAGAEQVGLYSYAYRFGQIPLFLLITPFLLIWYPFVFSLRDEARQRELVARVAPWVMAALTAVVLAEALFAEELAAIMAGNDAYIAGWRAIAIVCAGYWFWGLFQVVQTGFYVRKATARLPLITAVAVLVNFVANFALIPRLGFMGAAWATLLAFMVLALITERAVRAVFPVPWPWRRILVPAAGAAAVYARECRSSRSPGCTRWPRSPRSSCCSW
jgi:O-antigen/teichoic acid export membrane protein